MEQRIQALFDDLNADALRFQELYCSERKHIAHLDEQRCAAIRRDTGSRSLVMRPAQRLDQSGVVH